MTISASSIPKPVSSAAATLERVSYLIGRVDKICDELCQALEDFTAPLITQGDKQEEKEVRRGSHYFMTLNNYLSDMEKTIIKLEDLREALDL